MRCHYGWGFLAIGDQHVALCGRPSGLNLSGLSEVLCYGDGAPALQLADVTCPDCLVIRDALLDAAVLSECGVQVHDLAGFARVLKGCGVLR